MGRICRLLAEEKATRNAGNPLLPDARRAALARVVRNAAKLFCNAVEELRGGDNRWSPELLDYLCDYPERVDASGDVKRDACAWRRSLTSFSDLL